MLQKCCRLKLDPMKTWLSFGAMLMTQMLMGAEEISFPAKDGGVVSADLYGGGQHGVVLAHGMRFDKGSWKAEATALAKAGYKVVAIDFRGYGKSTGGPKSKEPREEMYLDVLAAVAYLRGHGAQTVSVIGASMGGGASANASAKGSAGAIDRLILLAPVPIANPERIQARVLYATAQGDPITPQVKQQFAAAPEPKELVLIDGDAHAQFMFQTDQGERLMNEILRFLGGASKP